MKKTEGFLLTMSAAPAKCGYLRAVSKTKQSPVIVSKPTAHAAHAAPRAGAEAAHRRAAHAVKAHRRAAVHAPRAPRAIAPEAPRAIEPAAASAKHGKQYDQDDQGQH